MADDRPGADPPAAFKPAQGGIKGIRAKFADSAAKRPAPIVYPKPGDTAGWGYPAGQWTGYPHERMPPGIPVVALGKHEGVYYFFDATGQLNEIKRNDFNVKAVSDLFASCPDYLEHHWPKWGRSADGKPPKITGFDATAVMRCLMKACADAGVFAPDERVRGRGAWLTASGQLIWHAGAELFSIVKGKLVRSRPGMVEDMIYPGGKMVLTPWGEPVDPTDTPAHALLALFRTWSWERPALDPILMLGCIGCGLLGPALPWRPTFFLVGDKRVGKSTLQGVIRELFGNALLQTSDATAAGIYQQVGRDGLPIAVDELEARAEGNDRAAAIIALARIAASGAEMHRGSADHHGKTFTMRSVSIFSAINPPPLEPADRSRMILFNLAKLVAMRAPGSIMPGPEDGRMILRALMDAWPKFQATFAFFTEALAGASINDRGTYAVPLAIANLLLGDEAMEEAGLPITEPGAIGTMIAAATADERAEEGENWVDCIGYLLASLIDQFRAGQRTSIGTAIGRCEQALAQRGAGFGRLEDLEEFHTARDLVAQIGCGLRIEEPTAGDVRLLLCVPVKRIPQLLALFRDSNWRDGGWRYALRQAPPDVVVRDRGNGQNVKINRDTLRCLLIDMARYDQAAVQVA